jgi:23S rRNA (cytidine1920-2'-O)/16S rRNA (cytidine1409-2'-O)-methyltransferase
MKPKTGSLRRRSRLAPSRDSRDDTPHWGASTDEVASKAGARWGGRARRLGRRITRGGARRVAHALEVFGIRVAGRLALDIGASTGGFTDALLQRGAASVVALDVGHGQLDWRLRNDPRVIVREGVNARALTERDVPHRVDLVTIDVAFIALKHIFPAFLPFLNEPCDIVALVKPQFEAGRDEVGKGGLVTDPAVHDAVVARVTTEADAVGLRRVAMTPSPITGATGNREFFLHLRSAKC